MNTDKHRFFPLNLIAVFLVVVALAGCRDGGSLATIPDATSAPTSESATAEPATAEAATTRPDPTEETLSPTEEATDADEPTAEAGPRLSGVPEADAVIPALLAHDEEAIHELIHYSAIPCGTVEGLGGPPRCMAGEAEGTLVEVLPSLGAEGTHIRPDGMDMLISLLRTDELYAVYGLSEAVFADEWYPRGRYGILFVSDQEGVPATTVHVTEMGIVRIDYHLGQSPDEVMARESAVLLLAPQQ